MGRLEEGELYHYAPSKVAAILFAALFGISTVAHIYQSWIHQRRKAWFMTAFLVGALFEVVGYAARILSANDPKARNPFIIQTLLILLAPALMAATIYMILGRIILLTSGERFALIRRTWLTKIFVLGDVLSFVAQGIGGGMLSNNNGTIQEQIDRQKLGKNIILVGLWIQIIFFGLFLLVAILFQFRGRHHFKKLPAGLGWEKHMYTLYAVSALILVRSLFRVAEYIQGVDGFLYSHEVFLYIFDALLIFGAMAAMNVVHPADIARLLKEKDSYSSLSEMERLGSTADVAYRA
ncbi:RTA1-domain-containing protein [Lentithecium fluviatile CBS 122367]|uniref:RTA1-domain-containing protein n=1 Tax=Lentithecium fluviatile CBS 122367 TaxID=1168545 RepID=A0A6G1JMB7_9PLEO|nr:RTA1-domain-containing protein [Lentithecium fluviatile CBS 122367]